MARLQKKYFLVLAALIHSGCALTLVQNSKDPKTPDDPFGSVNAKPIGSALSGFTIIPRSFEVEVATNPEDLSSVYTISNLSSGRPYLFDGLKDSLEPIENLGCDFESPRSHVENGTTIVIDVDPSPVAFTQSIDCSASTGRFTLVLNFLPSSVGLISTGFTDTLPPGDQTLLQMSPDGKFIAWVSNSGAGPHDQIFVKNRVTGQTRIVTRDEQSGIHRGRILQFSMDSVAEKFIFVSAMDPRFSNDWVAHRNCVLVTSRGMQSLQNSIGRTQNCDEVAMTSDGQYAAIVTNPAYGGILEIKRIELRGEQVIVVPVPSVMSYPDHQSRVSISDDGQKIAFQTSAYSNIFVYDFFREKNILVSSTEDGTDLPGSQHLPTISRDGRRVVFASDEGAHVHSSPLEGRNYQYYLKDLETQALTMISVTQDGFPFRGVTSFMRPSIDGEAVNFWANPDQSPLFTLYQKNISTGALQIVSQLGADNYAPAVADYANSWYLPFGFTPSANNGALVAFRSNFSMGSTGLGNQLALIRDFTSNTMESVMPNSDIPVPRSTRRTFTISDGSVIFEALVAGGWGVFRKDPTSGKLTRLVEPNVKLFDVTRSGSKLLYSNATDPGTIKIKDLNTNKARVLNSRFTISEARLSTDGTHAVFVGLDLGNRRSSRECMNSANDTPNPNCIEPSSGESHVYLLNFTTGRTQKISQGVNCSEFCGNPFVNRDGSVVVFSANAPDLEIVESGRGGRGPQWIRLIPGYKEIYRMDMTSGNLSLVTSGMFYDDYLVPQPLPLDWRSQNDGDSTPVALSEDGKRVIFVTNSRFLTGNSSKSGFVMYNHENFTVTNLNPNLILGHTPSSLYYAPTSEEVDFTSDGTKIVYWARHKQYDSQLFHTDLTTNMTTILSRDATGAVVNNWTFNSNVSIQADGSRTCFSSNLPIFPGASGVGSQSYCYSAPAP